LECGLESQSDRLASGLLVFDLDVVQVGASLGQLTTAVADGGLWSCLSQASGGKHVKCRCRCGLGGGDGGVHRVERTTSADLSLGHCGGLDRCRCCLGGRRSGLCGGSGLRSRAAFAVAVTTTVTVATNFAVAVTTTIAVATAFTVAVTTTVTIATAFAVAITTTIAVATAFAVAVTTTVTVATTFAVAVTTLGASSGRSANLGTGGRSSAFGALHGLETSLEIRKIVGALDGRNADFLENFVLTLVDQDEESKDGHQDGQDCKKHVEPLMGFLLQFLALFPKVGTPSARGRGKVPGSFHSIRLK
jgi:hypothetical protein